MMNLNKNKINDKNSMKKMSQRQNLLKILKITMKMAEKEIKRKMKVKKRKMNFSKTQIRQLRITK